MWRERIGEDAGILWLLLSEQGPRTLPQLRKLSLLDEQRIWLALGWLAREDKVEMIAQRGRDAVALTG